MVEDGRAKAGERGGGAHGRQRWRIGVLVQ